MPAMPRSVWPANRTRNVARGLRSGASGRQRLSRRPRCASCGRSAGRPGDWPDAPADWQSFAATGHRPDASALSYVFRAITPPGRPRRFDARFFVMPAELLASDPDDFSAATEELSHLHWVLVRDARALDLPFITTLVLGEVEALLPDLGTPARVPFFRNDAAWAVLDDATPPR